MIVGEVVHSAQRTFRTLIAALAHPGRVCPIVDRLEAPAPLTPVSAAAAVALFDGDVAVWIDARHGEAATWLTGVTGVRRTDDPSAATFAVLDASALEPLAAWNAGTAEEPESSTTLLIRVTSLVAGLPVSLRGPGIDGTIAFAPSGLPAAFWNAWSQNTRSYPRGFDCFFFDEVAVTGLPRTAQRVSA